MTREQVIAIIREQISEVAQMDGGSTLDISSPLSQVGIDSKTSMELLVKIEMALDVVVEDDELVPENFTTIEKIVDLMMPKINS